MLLRSTFEDCQKHSPSHGSLSSLIPISQICIFNTLPYTPIESFTFILQKLSSKFQSLDLNAPLHDAASFVSLGFPCSSPSYQLQIMGYCRGFLFLELDSDSQLVIWNPSTRVCKNIPPIPSQLSAFLYGFGYDSFTDDYLIVLALYNSNSSSVSGTEIHIFSVRTNSWKQLEGCFTFISPIDRPDPSTGSVAGSTLNGAIHWLALCAEAGQASSHAAIISLDLTEKSLREFVPLPGDFNYETCELKELGGCLGLIGTNNSNQIEIWMMREYGVESSWSMHMCLSLADELLAYYISPICFTKDGQVVAVCGTRLMKLDEKGEVVECSGHDLDGFDADGVVYAESLFCLRCGQEQSLEH